jgi:hypothetical protein
LKEEQASVREIKWDAFKKYSEDQLEAEQQHAAELERQVSALKQQLQEAEIHYKKKVGSYLSSDHVPYTNSAIGSFKKISHWTLVISQGVRFRSQGLLG